MCSNCSGDYEDPEMTAEPDELTDALGTDLLQAYLAAVHASHMRRESLRNLIGHVQHSSPLVERHKLNISWDEV